VKIYGKNPSGSPFLPVCRQAGLPAAGRPVCRRQTKPLLAPLVLFRNSR